MATEHNSSWLTILTALLIIWLSYFLCLTIWRITFSPIAHIPGPPLAAASFWYEYYYDVILKGRYTWKIEELHKKYGPVVRVNPYEVHIKDSELYDTVFLLRGGGHKIDSWAWSRAMFGNPLSMFGTVDHDHHKIRRVPLNPFFSMQATRSLEPRIDKCIDRLLDQVASYRHTGTPANMSDLFACFSGDVILEYAFGASIGLLTNRKNHKNWRSGMSVLVLGGPLSKHFPLWGKFLRAVPAWLLGKLDSRLESFGDMITLFRKYIHSAQSTTPQNGTPALSPTTPVSSPKQKSTQHATTMIEELVYGDLPQAEKRPERLLDECQALVGAGSLTTAEILSAALCQILLNPTIKSKLQGELKSAASRPRNASNPNIETSNSRIRLDLVTLESLPYLNAVIKETLRRHFGIMSRLQRVHNIPLSVHELVIPAGTPVSMSAYFVHTDPSIFPDPFVFNPDRWLGQSSQTLDRYLVSFSKGPRNCIGMNLAWAELRLCLAALFLEGVDGAASGGLEFELYQTGLPDILAEHDYFVPLPRFGSVGVRVLVK